MNFEIQSLPLHQQRIVQQVQSFVRQHLSLTNLSVNDLAHELGISERKLFRLIKTTLQTTPNGLIQEIRLEKAKELLEIGEYATVAEVSYAVGYSRPDYFSSVFEKKFGRKPKSFKHEWKTCAV